MAMFDGDYGFWPAGHPAFGPMLTSTGTEDVERERLAMAQQQAVGGLGALQQQQPAGFAAQQQRGLQGLWASADLFNGGYPAEFPRFGPGLEVGRPVKTPKPRIPWSCIWFYTWRVGAGVAWGLWWWWFSVTVK